MKKIFVGNLDFDATEDQLRELFNTLGEVRKVEIAKDWETGHSRGFAFVVMGSEAEARRAVQALHGKHLDGRRLTVRPAPSTPPVGFNSLSFNR